MAVFGHFYPQNPPLSAWWGVHALVICQSSAAPQSRALYMGLGDEHSFETSLGNSTGGDLMYRSPRITEAGSCHASTEPVRGAVASFGNSPG